MKVIFESRNGSTKKLAEEMSKALGKGVECWDLKNGVDISKISEGELIFLGSGAYGGKPGEKVQAFIRDLGKSKKKVRMALFGTSCAKDAAVKGMRKLANKQGIKPLGDTFNCPGKFLFLNGSRPNQADLNGATNFATRLTKN